MRLSPPHTGVAGPARPSARSVLGASHPLVRTIEALSAVARQSLAVAALLAASLVAAGADAGWARPTAASAAVVLAGLAATAALLLQRRREEVVALIAAGDGDVPVRVVERERRRLLSSRMRGRLAASLGGLVDEATGPPAIPGPPLFDPRVVTAVADELRDVAALLCSERSDARATALVWRLVCDGVESPLHRGEVEELREELGRIRFLLSTGSVHRRGTATGSAGDARDEADHP